MPRKYSVIGCRGNYQARKGEHADVNKASVFRFPKEGAMAASEPSGVAF